MIQVTAKELMKAHKRHQRKMRSDEITTSEQAKQIFNMRPYYMMDKGIKKNDSQL